MDHTYHHDMTMQDLDRKQRKQIESIAEWMKPGHIIFPWIWYPGDLVEATEGDFTAQRGQIQTVIQFKNQIIVTGINVDTIEIPASEGQPAQKLDREHPISVKMVKHVDPTNNEWCDVKLIKVRNKETKKLEERRISLTTGALIEIPEKKKSMNGDPIKDTGIDDATEETFDEEKEIAVMTQQKLKRLEQGFVDQLRIAHEHHEPFQRANYESQQQYMLDVQRKAASMLLQSARKVTEWTGNECVDDEQQHISSEIALEPKAWWFDAIHSGEDDSVDVALAASEE